MNENFASAAARHWEDAEILYRSRRFDNCAYLSGYVVECALKVLIQAGGLSPRAFGHELLALTGKGLQLACLLAPGLRRYPLPRVSVPLQDLLQGWTPEMRYWATARVVEPTARLWRQAAEETYRGIVVAAVLDGWS